MTDIARFLVPGGAAIGVRAFVARLSGKNVVYPLGYMASLDGTRGLLTIGVLLAHTHMTLFGGAMVYMDVFFTMSGYLITSLLIKDYQKHGRISLKNFYARRIMRLYPALTAMVASLIVLSWIFSTEFKDRINEALVTWFYLMDYGWLWNGLAEYTSHTWSLAVEEQFYILWPLLFIALLRLGITVRMSLVIFALAAMFWLWRIIIDYDGAPIGHLYYSFDTRADALLIGCGLAVLLKAVDVSSYPHFSRFCSVCLMPIALALIVMMLTMNHDMRWYYYVSPLFGAIPGAIGIIGLLHRDRTYMHRICEHPVPVFIGRICYGLYLWHFPIFVLIGNYAPHGTIFFAKLLIGWPLVFAIATLSHYLIERPFMRVRPGF